MVIVIIQFVCFLVDVVISVFEIGLYVNVLLGVYRVEVINNYCYYVVNNYYYCK